jgi:predicted Zn-dependent protease
MVLSVQDARALATRIVDMTRGDAVEVIVESEYRALTRFANNRIHQNVAEDNAFINIRAVVGRAVGVASTNRLDEESLATTANAAWLAATTTPPEPTFPGLPAPSFIREAERVSPATRAYDADARAAAVAGIVGESASRGLTAAGAVQITDRTLAVSTSMGIEVGQEVTDARATVLSMGPESGSGWAAFLGTDAGLLDAAQLGERAADLAQRSANPGTLEPGEYAVVLAPEAVADILDYLGYVGFSGKAFAEKRSFMSDRIGQKVMSERVSIIDFACSPDTVGCVIDYEGQPRHRIEIITNGVAIEPVTDSYWARRLRLAASGHALPAPNAFGPMALNLEMAPGDSTLDELIGSVKRGVYVTRLHYVNVEDPIPVTLTGMTRDGTFLIENGKLTRPLKNLRFTQSAIQALCDLEGVTRERRLVATEEGAVFAPGLLISRFAFTGQTS